jgi:hypothetical protein
MNRGIDRLIVKEVFKNSMARKSETYLDGWLDNQNYYSTNMADAWKVIEHLEKEYASVEIHIAEGMSNVIITERFKDGHLKDTYQGYEKSTALAICMAALKTVGI